MVRFDSKEAHEELQATIEGSLAQVMEGKQTASGHMKAVGERMVALIRNRVTDGLQPENHPVTILLKVSGEKKSAKPLVRSGHLLESLTWKPEECHGT